MRILLISEVTSRMLGGVPAETAHFIRGFAARGHAVGLLGDKPLPSAPQADHYTLTMPAGERIVAETQRAIDAFRPSVVHVMGLFPRNTLRLAPLLSGSGLPWVFTCHAVSPYERTVAGLHGSEWLHYAARALRYARNTLGARLLTDLVMGRPSELASVYSPSRWMPGALRSLLGSVGSGAW